MPDDASAPDPASTPPFPGAELPLTTIESFVAALVEAFTHAMTDVRRAEAERRTT